jgi:flagella basal body P-ring formation protein FlgA
MWIHQCRFVKGQLKRFALVLCASLMCGLAPAVAQTGANPEFYATAQHWLDASLAKQSSALPLRAELVMGQIDSRLQLAPCQRIEPYLPAGMQLWGKTRLGLRCTQGAVKWNVFLPITVKAFGPAWVIKGTVAPGAALTEADAMAVEVDWAETSSPIVANQSDWLGKSATRQLTTGQALRQDMVRAAQVFQAGAQVRVLAVGPGFEIASRAQAISAGVVGQSVRVRMDNGQVLSGTVMDERTVKVLI